MKKLNNLFSNIFQIFFFGGVVSNIFLSILMLTDSYFYNLKFSEENFHIKIVKYFTFTVYIPLFIMALFIILRISKSTLKIEKINMSIYGILGVVMFICFDKTIKKVAIFSEYSLFNVILLILVYFGLFLWFTKRIKNLIINKK
jgi:hypothetical protein